MGLDTSIPLGAKPHPSWERIVSAAAQRNLSISLVMIDGELSFPGEIPPEGWRELRLKTPEGMITLRKEPNAIRSVIWGNADERLRTVWSEINEAIGRAIDSDEV